MARAKTKAKTKAKPKAPAKPKVAADPDLAALVSPGKSDGKPTIPGEEAAPREEATPRMEADLLEPDHRSELEALVQAEGGQTMTSAQGVVAPTDELADQLTKAPVEHHLAPDADLLKILAEQHGMEYVQLSDFTDLGKDLKILRLIPSDLAKELKVFPIHEEDDGSLKVAICDPLDVTIIDNLRLLTSRTILPVIATEDDILDRVDLHYGIGDETLEKMVEDIEAEGAENVLADSAEVDLNEATEAANQPTVIRLVNLLLLNVIKDRASDLHIEPFGGTLRVRYRVDGVLREIQAPPKSLQTGIVSRFKVMASMNISETRRPQDGRIRLTMGGREVDLRVSTLPTVHGESMVMRVLDKAMMMLGLEQIGMGPDCLEKFSRVIKKPNGIILVTGPTGCGKTTTLYAAIQAINDPGEKLITTEDPVEYQVPGLIQININEGVGLTFAACLRAILRQDPDTILVGEIRDVETGQIAIQASLTGHLVFSTLHTNSAAATISRLIDMGVEPFLLTSTLETIIGQRLVRTICPLCAKEQRPDAEELADFGATLAEVEGMTFAAGAGCTDCAQTGYKGRIGLFEIMMISNPIRDMILDQATAEMIHSVALKEGMETMRHDGWRKVQGRVTTLNEVAHHTPRESSEQTRREMDSVLRKGGEVSADRAPVAGQSAPTAAPMPWESESAAPTES